MTTRTPSMVSEVSAIDVASTILRRARRRGRNGEILRARVQGAIERRDVDVRPPIRALKRLRDAADLALARQEDEDRAASPRRAPRASRARPRPRCARQGCARRSASRPERRGPRFRSAAHRQAAREPARRRASPTSPEGAGPRARPACASSASARPRSASSERSWNSSNRTAADAFERRIVEDHAREHALGDDLDARARRDQALQAHAQADRLADFFAERRGHARRRGARGETARLEHEESLARGPRFVEEGERDARRLARAGRGDQHRARACAQARPEGREAHRRSEEGEARASFARVARGDKPLVDPVEGAGGRPTSPCRPCVKRGPRDRGTPFSKASAELLPI